MSPLARPTPYLRNSERTSFLNCRHAWYWSYDQTLAPRREAVYFRIGTLIHKALELYYIPGTRRGIEPARTYDKLTKNTPPDELRVKSGENWIDGRELGIYMLRNYVEKWRDADLEYRVIQSERTVQVPIGKLLPIGKSLPRSAPSIVVAKIDGVWQHRKSGRYRFIDHKTATTISTHHLSLDPQASMYWLIGPMALRIAPEQFDGILYNFLRKYMPAEDQAVNELGQNLNQDGSVSKRQPAATFHRELIFRDAHERELEKARILNVAREIGMVRERKLAVMKMPGLKCNFCAFSDACELHEAGQDFTEYMRQTTTTWKPYEDHDLDPVD